MGDSFRTSGFFALLFDQQPITQHLHSASTVIHNEFIPSHNQ
jgi:hypothetical protein